MAATNDAHGSESSSSHSAPWPVKPSQSSAEIWRFRHQSQATKGEGPPCTARASASGITHFSRQGAVPALLGGIPASSAPVGTATNMLHVTCRARSHGMPYVQADKSQQRCRNLTSWKSTAPLSSRSLPPCTPTLCMSRAERGATGLS